MLSPTKPHVCGDAIPEAGLPRMANGPYAAPCDVEHAAPLPVQSVFDAPAPSLLVVDVDMSSGHFWPALATPTLVRTYRYLPCTALSGMGSLMTYRPGAIVTDARPPNETW